MDISGSHAPLILSVVYLLVGNTTNLNGGKFRTGEGFSLSVPTFVSITTGWLSVPFITSNGCDYKDTSYYEFYT